MHLDRVHPDLRGPVRRLPSLPLQRRGVRRLIRWAQPRFTAESVGEGVHVETTAMPGGVPLRVYRPSATAATGSLPGLLWVHGGGLVIGSPIMDDPLCAAFVRATGAVVVSVDYRLAPEHPFPAGLDDVAATWSWFVDGAARLGVDPDRLAVGGQSAGGGLAAALTQRLRDTEPLSARRPVAQLLLCPMLDDRTAARTELDAERHRAWSNRQNRFGWGAYLGAAPGGAEVPPYAVPARRERLDGLPPAWIGVGDIDLFHDEDAAYAGRLQDAGVPCTLVTVPGAPHGFESWAPGTTIAQDHVARAAAWLQGALESDQLRG